MGQRTGWLFLPAHLIAHQRPLCDSPPLPHRNICLAHVCRCLVTFMNEEVSSFSLVCSTQLKCTWRSSDFTFSPSCLHYSHGCWGLPKEELWDDAVGHRQTFLLQSRCFRGAQIWQSLSRGLCQAPTSGIHSINTLFTPVPCSCIFISQQWLLWC